MAERNLSYFMRPEAVEEAVIEVPGIESIKDEKGQVVPFLIKKLSNEHIQQINDMYTEKSILKDKKGNFVIQNGQAVYRVDKDSARAARHIMVEALVYPDLKDKKLMEYFKCVDVTSMPLKVFPDSQEYAQVSRKVMSVLGMLTPDEDDDSIEEDAKN